LASILASHALLLLAGGVVLLAVSAAVVAALAARAARHRDQLWALVDLVVPGDLIRPRTYLAVHLALGLLVVASATAFVVIAEDVVAGREISAFDVQFARALAAESSPVWNRVFRIVTFLGNGTVIFAIAAVVAIGLARRHHTLLLIMWIVSQSGSAVLNYALKGLFARARPDGADPALHGGGWSFPSGHAMNTLVLCGIAAYLLLRLRPWRGTLGLQIALLLAWALAVGFSRLYVGVHYVSDVVAGFLAGAAWIAVCVSGVEVARRRGSGRSADPGAAGPPG
jgi:undecaprenyl-diphosphatase